MLEMTLSIFVFIVSLVLVTLAQCTERLRIPDYGSVAEDGFTQRTKRQESVENPSSAEDDNEDDEVRLLQEIPTMLLIKNEKEMGCTGILITERIIIAPAFCVKNSNVTVDIVTKTNYPQVKVFPAYLFSDSVNELHLNISHVIQHPNVNETLQTHDIAILKLEKRVNTVLPSCLWLDSKLIPSKPMVVEWVFDRYELALHRKELQNLIDNINCLRYLQPIPPHNRKPDVADYHICIFSRENYLNICLDSTKEAKAFKRATLPKYREETFGFNCLIARLCAKREDFLGPLYTDLVYDGHIIPYVIGFSSFSIRALYDLHTFVKISNFVPWIKETIQELGEKVPSSLLDPLACAKEHLDHHRKINGSLPLVKNETIVSLVKIQKNPEAHQNSNCAGTLIGEDFVVTLAQCATNLIAFSSRVVLSDSSYITIRDVFIHPDYTEDSFYNNIALLKLAEKSNSRPAILDYDFIEHNEKVNLYGKQRNNNTQFEDSSGLPVKAQGLSILLNHKCSPTEEQRLRLAQGLQFEHVCLQNDLSLVPGSCEADPGSPVFRWSPLRFYGDKYSPGLYMFGQNCGFGEPAIAVLFLAHKTWIDSILNAPSRDPVVVTIPNLELSDECTYPEGTKGTCVAQTSCPNINKRVQNNLPIFFCKVRSIVCCPQYSIEDEFTFAINRS